MRKIRSGNPFAELIFVLMGLFLACAAFLVVVEANKAAAWPSYTPVKCVEACYHGWHCRNPLFTSSSSSSCLAFVGHMQGNRHGSIIPQTYKAYNSGVHVAASGASSSMAAKAIAANFQQVSAPSTSPSPNDHLQRQSLSIQNNKQVNEEEVAAGKQHGIVDGQTSDHSKMETQNSPTSKSDWKIPRHVAVVCDGNSRWAKQRNLPTNLGHLRGAQRLVDDVIPALVHDGVEVCTFYAFSSENWNRSEGEINALWSVIANTAQQFRQHALKEGLRIRIIGDLDDARIPTSLRKLLRNMEEETAFAFTSTSTDSGRIMHTSNELAPVAKDASSSSSNQNLHTTLCLAINYGGRQDLIQATQKLARQVAAGVLSPDDIDEAQISNAMWTAGLPPPDLVIRTSGESRLSNFLLWNAAYSELYITPTLWPDFDEVAWKDALLWYQHRKRRFGGRENK